MPLINSAYEVLSHSDLTAEYDRSRDKKSGHHTAPARGQTTTQSASDQTTVHLGQTQPSPASAPSTDQPKQGRRWLSPRRDEQKVVHR